MPGVTLFFCEVTVSVCISGIQVVEELTKSLDTACPALRPVIFLCCHGVSLYQSEDFFFGKGQLTAE